MASRFVSGGTLEKPTERDDEWLRAQQELEETRRQKTEESKQNDGKTLYEVLQQNKAAKQEAFEESAKLKNQFRALNNDEVDFLDSALESTRAREEAIRKETREQLELFRRRQEQADKVGEADEDATKGSLTGVEGAQKSLENDVEWNVSTKKRKRVKEKEGLKGVKTRRTSSTDDQKQEAEAAVANVEKERPKCSSSGAAAQSNSVSTTSSPLSVKQTPGKLVANGQVSVLPAAKGSLALVGYDSEDEST